MPLCMEGLRHDANDLSQHFAKTKYPCATEVISAKCFKCQSCCISSQAISLYLSPPHTDILTTGQFLHVTANCVNSHRMQSSADTSRTPSRLGRLLYSLPFRIEATKRPYHSGTLHNFLKHK